MRRRALESGQLKLSLEDSKNRIDAERIDPRKLSGLMMPAYILKCLEGGMSEKVSTGWRACCHVGNLLVP